MSSFTATDEQVSDLLNLIAEREPERLPVMKHMINHALLSEHAASVRIHQLRTLPKRST